MRNRFLAKCCFSTEDPRILLNNNKTLETLTIHTCEFVGDDPDPTRATPISDPLFLNIDRSDSTSVQIILNSINTPQFGDLDIVHVSLHNPCMVVRATDNSDRTLEYSQPISEDSHYHPRQYLGTRINALHLGVGATFLGLLSAPVFSGFFSTPLVPFKYSSSMERSPIASRTSSPNPGCSPGLKLSGSR